jgi:hypothetical protein
MGRRGVWRRPPFTVPRGRRPNLWRSPRAYLRNAAPGEAVIASMWAAVLVRNSVDVGWTALVILTVLLVAPAFAYGVALLATSRSGAHRVLPPMGYGTAPSAGVWLGLAIVLSGVLGGIGATFFYQPTAGDHVWWMFFFFAPSVVAVGCLLTGYVVSMRPIKATIVAGLAPTFVTSPDHLWWWDGRQWFGVPSVAPLHALRSPDGNHWWSGDRWCPMPALPPRKPRGSPSASLA